MTLLLILILVSIFNRLLECSNQTRLLKHRNVTSTSNPNLLTFRTSIIGSRDDSNHQVRNDERMFSSYGDHTEIRLSYHHNKFYFLLLVVLMLAVSVGAAIWCAKKTMQTCLIRLCLRRCRTMRTSHSVTGLSGECGCVFRVRKHTSFSKSTPNTNLNFVISFINGTRSETTNGETISPAKFVFIELKSRQHEIFRDIHSNLASKANSEDLSSYSEYEKQSLLDLKTSLNTLENL